MSHRCLSVAATLLLSAAPLLSQSQIPPTAPSTGAAPPAISLSATLEPALTALRQTLGSLHPDKWKLSADLRRRTADNVTSIRGDLDNTLPGLLNTADNSRAPLVDSLAVARNLDALYDVALRVTATSELSAPDPQAQALVQSLGSLNDARQRLDNRIRSLAESQQQQLADLQTSLTRANTALSSANAALQTQQSHTPTHTTTKSKPHTTKKPATPTPSQ